MEKELLLLPSARHPGTVWALWVRRVAIAIGILAVLVGLADVSSRLSARVLGSHALFDTFAPAAAL